jgi:hypothetical protein
MNSKITIFALFVFLCLIATSTMQAQVTISPAGSDNTTHNGAVLKLVSNTSPGQGQGLLLPKVTLTSSTVWGLVSGSTPAEGMMVYNLSTSTANGLKGQGIYVWTANNKWLPMQYQLPCSGAPIIGAITAPQTHARNDAFEASVTAIEGATYTWTTSGANAKGYSNTNIISLVGLQAGTLTITVTATNACGTGNTQTTTVTIQ